MDSIIHMPPAFTIINRGMKNNGMESTRMKPLSRVDQDDWLIINEVIVSEPASGTSLKYASASPGCLSASV